MGGQSFELLLVVLAVGWLAIAIGLSVVAARRVALAQQILAGARNNARLLAIGPARPGAGSTASFASVCSRAMPAHIASSSTSTISSMFARANSKL